MEHVVIIGNGISGITAARHIRKLSDKKITVISAETDYFFSRTALMYVYMGHLKFEHTQPYEDGFWKRNNICLKKGRVSKIETTKKELSFEHGEILSYDTLIIASGSKPNSFGWKGEHLNGVQGLYSKQDLDTLEKNTKKIQRAVIVGGGLIGIELAEMLTSRAIPVTFLVREESFWNNVLPKEESELINRHIREHHIDLRLSTHLLEILPDENGRVGAIITDAGEEVPCQLVGLTAGVSPHIDFLKESAIETHKGVLVNCYLETNIPDVYAIGDCAEQREPIGFRKPVEAVWYTGRIMGETVAQTICSNKTAYCPGHWFNSAKFFDIEYQTYGWVWAKPKTCEEQFYWEAADGKKCIRVSYHKETKVFLGINTLGIRMKHPFFDAALTKKQTVNDVIAHLKHANFDPEFFKRYEKEIQQAFVKFNDETAVSSKK
jgi:NAD(P)H-nitrite reductase large subunit